MTNEKSERREILLKKANEIFSRAHPAQNMAGVMADLAEWALDNQHEFIGDKSKGGWISPGGKEE